ncbi:WYL domain-containing protein [Nakamurella antarctica]|uniref:WYL domain-containing protein n=1 Tax=Nakamurella antarctica TaxID=1902245 RepID=A0A3G8ZMA4_9ACTN|nr:WYL domain-containing protein [Nakamurella antarctica]AZI57917.1 WYL domain-containing protein [Nakamurella antarctica]
MAKTKAERLLNLVIALLNGDKYRDVSWIRAHVDGYDRVDSAAAEEAFFRMFERDKGELRDLGIPLQTNDAGAYRIPPGEFALPEVSFTPAEMAALGLAGRLWETTVLAEAGSGALRKLVDAGAGDAAGDLAVADSITLLQPRVRTSDPAFAPLYAAVQARRAVEFEYRKGSTDAPVIRHLRPWGLVSWKGRWYVVGFDPERGGQRTFRLSRIAGPVKAVGAAGTVTVPPNLDLLAIVMNSTTPEPVRMATVRLATDAAAGLRRKAQLLPADPDYPDFDRVHIHMDHLWDTARSLAGLGPHAVVESPPELIDAVVTLLRGARGGVPA